MLMAEAPDWGANEYPQYMFLWRNMKNMTPLLSRAMIIIGNLARFCPKSAKD